MPSGVFRLLGRGFVARAAEIMLSIRDTPGVTKTGCLLFVLANKR